MKLIECDICTHEWEALIGEEDTHIRCPHCSVIAGFTVLNAITD